MYVFIAPRDLGYRMFWINKLWTMRNVLSLECREYLEAMRNEAQKTAAICRVMA